VILKEKLSWRAKLIASKIAGKEIAGWKHVLKEVLTFDSMKGRNTYILKANDISEEFLKATFVSGLEIIWPKMFDTEVLNILYAEIYGPSGCIYEIPGYVEISKDDVVIDGGACEGFFALYSLSKGAKVICVEPNPLMASALKMTLKPWINEGRAIIVEKLLDEVQGSGELYLNYKNVGASSAKSTGFLDLNKKPSITVEKTTIDALVEELDLARVDFIKLDVEGFEKEIIRGSKKVIQNCKPKWAVASYHLPDDYVEIPSLLKDINKEYKISTKEYSLKLHWGPPYLRPTVVFAS